MELYNNDDYGDETPNKMDDIININEDKMENNPYLTESDAKIDTELDDDDNYLQIIERKDMHNKINKNYKNKHEIHAKYDKNAKIDKIPKYPHGSRHKIQREIFNKEKYHKLMNQDQNMNIDAFTKAILQPDKAKIKMELKIADKIWNIWTETEIFPAEYSLEQVLYKFDKKEHEYGFKSCLEGESTKNKNFNDANKLVNDLRRLCMEYNRIKQHASKNLDAFDQIKMDILSASCPLPGIVIIEVFRIILNKISRNNGGFIRFIDFTFTEFCTAASELVIQNIPVLHTYLSTNKVPEGTRKQELLLYVGEKTFELPTGTVRSKTSWNQIIKQRINTINAFYGGKNMRGRGRGRYRGRGSRGNRGRSRYNNYGSRGRGRANYNNNNNNYGNNAVYGIKKRLLDLGLSMQETNKVMTESKESNSCIEYNYFDCEYGNKCNFDHICSHCNRPGHKYADCNDNTQSDKVLKMIAKNRKNNNNNQ